MSKDIDKKKRVRAPNFTVEETRILLNLALGEKNILENKKTDSQTWTLKDETWRKIADLFNASSGQTFRSVDTLRQKYDSMKKGLKKKVIKNKEETMKTGGGKPEYILIDDSEKELLEVLSVTINGLPSCFDSDSVLPETTVTGEVLSQVPNIQIMQQVTGEVLLEVPNEEMKRQQKTLSHEPQIHLSPITEDEVAEYGVAVSNPEKKWKNWSPASLQTKKHPVLTPRRTRETHNKKMDAILELREELLKNQISNVKNDERRAQERHEKEMELIHLNILIKSKDLEKLN